MWLCDCLFALVSTMIIPSLRRRPLLKRKIEPLTDAAQNWRGGEGVSSFGSSSSIFPFFLHCSHLPLPHLPSLSSSMICSCIQHQTLISIVNSTQVLNSIWYIIEVWYSLRETHVGAYWFAECIPSDTQETTHLPSVTYKTLSKISNFAECRTQCTQQTRKKILGKQIHLAKNSTK